jgi:hypothetical protein
MGVVGGDVYWLKLEILLSGYLQQCEVKVGVQGQNLHIADGATLKITIGLAMKNRDCNPGLPFYDMVVGHAVAAIVDDKSRAQTAGGFDEHHALTECGNEFLDRALRKVPFKVDGCYGGVRGWPDWLAGDTLLDLVHRDPDHIDTDIHKQGVSLDFQDLTLNPLAGFHDDHIRSPLAAEAKANQSRAGSFRGEIHDLIPEFLHY